MTILVTTSWDDGHPADLRIADRLAKYGLRGTFYVPNRNVEGHPVLEAGDLRTLAGSSEIGGHSRDHVVLTAVPPIEARRQIVENKAWLEQTLGHQVEGFCYVRGRYNRVVKRLVSDAGYRYARTTRTLASAHPADPLELPTTFQLFEHGPIVYAKNYLKGPISPSRTVALLQVLQPGGLGRRLERLARHATRWNGYLHLWGHSWEVERFGLWGQLDEALSILAALGAQASFVTNGDVARQLGSRG